MAHLSWDDDMGSIRRNRGNGAQPSPGDTSGDEGAGHAAAGLARPRRRAASLAMDSKAVITWCTQTLGIGDIFLVPKLSETLGTCFVQRGVSARVE